MPHDVESLQQMNRIFLAITAVCVTLFPLLYASLSPWYRSHLGRAVLLQSLSIALAIDISAYAQFATITDDISTIFIVNISFFAFISLASLYLLAALFYYNFKPKKEHQDAEHKIFPH